MFSLSRTLPRASRSTNCTSCLRQLSTSRHLVNPSLRPKHPSIPRQALLLAQTRLLPPSQNKTQTRHYAEKSSADAVIEEITEQFATAKDEFEIASEETEKKSVYAEEDRKAAREELDRLKEMYEDALQGEDGEEVQRRIGQRIRELDMAVQALERSALEE